MDDGAMSEPDDFEAFDEFSLGGDDAEADLDPGVPLAASAVRQDVLSGDGAMAGDPSAFAPPEVDVKALFPNSDEMAQPRICSTICYVNLGVPVDLRKLACGACYVEYNTKRNAGAVMRIREPPCAAIIRSSGTMIITGASSVGAAKRAAELAARVIRKVLRLGDKLKQIVFRVKSLTVRLDLKHPLRLEDMHLKNQNICSYEPETFCGCIVRLRGPAANPWKVSANVYVSGKCTFVGARSTDEIRWAYNTLLPIIAPFAKGSTMSQSEEGTQDGYCSCRR